MDQIGTGSGAQAPAWLAVGSGWFYLDGDGTVYLTPSQSTHTIESTRGQRLPLRDYVLGVSPELVSAMFADLHPIPIWSVLR
jgi:hypothetical protein